jgi:histone deacetylase complex subunit SAP18
LQRCPLLLRMFAKTGGHNRVHEYRQHQFPDNELSIHTWMDADLRELAELVKQTQSSARGKDAVMEFSLVYPDKRGINVMKLVSP